MNKDFGIMQKHIVEQAKLCVNIEVTKLVIEQLKKLSSEEVSAEKSEQLQKEIDNVLSLEGEDFLSQRETLDRLLGDFKNSVLELKEDSVLRKAVIGIALESSEEMLESLSGKEDTSITANHIFKRKIEEQTASYDIPGLVEEMLEIIKNKLRFSL